MHDSVPLHLGGISGPQICGALFDDLWLTALLWHTSCGEAKAEYHLSGGRVGYEHT